MRSAVARLALFAILFPVGCASDGTDPASPPPPSETASATTTETERREPARLRLEEVATDFESPVHITAAPGEPDRLYVVEQEGQIEVLENGSRRAEPFLDIRELVEAGGEQGLLSVAFHPEYEENGRFYVDYTDVNGDTRVVEYRAEGEPRHADAQPERVLLEVDQPYSNHNGGQLAFGPDGLLYVGMGDGGSGGDPDNRAQDLGDRLGKLLRLDVDDEGADWEIAAYGLRNPWRFSFDSRTGDLYLGDVGQGAWEELDYLPRANRDLVNFGWDVFEGRARFEDKEPNPEGRLVSPVVVYPLEGGNCSVIAGFVYRGDAIPSIEGRYFYGDYCSGTIWSFRIADGKAMELRRERIRVEGLTSFGEDGRGGLYLTSHEGTIYRLTAS
ncbi:MAG: PQQ-dependent sugar dehydrogenase [Actinomycetota bacterium]|nr:PQQ-dependent sugar dehydrogenase [Actinomycetota bacterium]